ncbi:MAG TPA: putative Ig domain-containing protein, partial [Thermomicrobiales bacterium]|nr:putative Ig domain-containing protein [Thermomicrobiales bacterium]
MNTPFAVTFDSSGNMYIADGNNNRIRKVSGGIISTFAGNGGLFTWAGDGGPALAGSFAFPTALAFGPGSALFISDSSNRRVRKIDSAGNLSTFAGNGLFKFTGDGGAAVNANLWAPYSGVPDAAGNLYITESSAGIIRKVTSGNIASIAGDHNFGFLGGGGSPASTAQLSGFVTYSAVDSAGNFYFSDSSNSRVRKIDTAGNIFTVAGNGNFTFSGDGVPALSTALNNPRGLAFDSAGNLYIADQANHRIRKVDTGGTITTVAGTGTAGFSGDGGLAVNAQLNGPEGIALDSAGNLYIVDLSNQRIRMVTPGGVIGTLAGTGTAGFSGDGGPATSANLNGPSGIAVDTVGNVFVADRASARIRRIDVGGTIFTVVGTGSASFSGDGGPALSAAINAPRQLNFDGGGNLFIADTNNDRIRKASAIGSTNAFGRLTITTTSLPNGALNSAYSGSLAAIGGTGALTWSVISGALPNGVTLNAATGALSNTALAAGTFTFNVQVHDSGAPQQTAFGIFSIAINPTAGSTLTFTSQPTDRLADSNITPAVQVQLLNAGSAPVVGATVSIAIGANPTGGILSGTLTALTDGTGTATFSNLNINAAGNAYTLTATVGTLAVASNAFNILPPSGNIVTVAGKTWIPPAGNVQATSYPFGSGANQGVAFDSSGNAYLADTANNQVEKVTPGGVLTIFAGNGTSGFSGDGGPATGAQLSAPVGVAVDSSNNVYISDRGNNRIRKVDSNGIVTTFAGNGVAAFAGDGGPALAASLNQPNGIAFDPSGNLHIADANNHRIRKISGGTITTVAGNGTATFAGDNGPATSASLNFPRGIAFDSSGNMYIADASNSIVRKMSGGTITTVAGVPSVFDFSG